MYTIIKNVINQGRFELSTIAQRLDVFCDDGKISRRERIELLIFASSKSDGQKNPQDAELIERIKKEAEEFNEHNA